MNQTNTRESNSAGCKQYKCISINDALNSNSIALSKHTLHYDSVTRPEPAPTTRSLDPLRRPSHLAIVPLPHLLQLLLGERRPQLVRPLLQLPRNRLPVAHEVPIALHDVAVHEHGLDVRVRRVEHDALEGIARAREVRRERVVDDDVRLLPDLDRANEVREVQRLGAAEGAEAEGVARVEGVVFGRFELVLVRVLVLAGCTIA